MSTTPPLPARDERHERERQDARDEGSGTILLLGIMGAVLVLLFAWCTVGAAVIAAHRADTAADLAAVTAARGLLLGNGRQAVCAEATSSARDNGALLIACDVRRHDVEVAVTVPLDEPLRHLGFTEAQGRAVAGVR